MIPARLLASPSAAVALACAFLVATAPVLSAENTNSMFKPKRPSPGGLNPLPEITRFQKDTNSALLEWFGLQGPYQIQQSPSLDNIDWQTLLETNSRSATVPAEDDHLFLRIQGAHPNYVGAATCVMCHPQSHDAWSKTAHARAFDTLKAINQHENSRCLACHTVGYGLPNGFKDEQSTPQFLGVQCENCHGPGGSHASNPTDASTRPVITFASQICGGCHNDAHHPTFDEWTESAHGHVTPSVANGFLSQGEPRMLQCGTCHSGAVRLALLNQIQHPSDPLPSREDAAYFSTTCTVCHNAHDNTLHSQLRNPVFSTNFFSYSTSSSTSFAAQYDPDTQICAQCHNQRGALWTDSSRPPHHSPQYNMLVGQIVSPGSADEGWNSTMSTHGNQLLQCAGCHTHPHEVDNPDDENPNYTGHTFEVQLEACVDCHGTTETAQLLITSTQSNIKSRIQEVKTLLDDWAATLAIEPLRDKYGTLSWEFNNPGDLSNPTGDSSLRGPTTAEQSGIPDEIKKARFLLYLVTYDGSYGLHNGRYARSLLDQAISLISQASNPPL